MNIRHGEPTYVDLGTFRGFKTKVKYTKDFNSMLSPVKVVLIGEGQYSIELSDSPLGMMAKIENVVNGLGEILAKQKALMEKALREKKTCRKS